MRSIGVGWKRLTMVVVVALVGLLSTSAVASAMDRGGGVVSESAAPDIGTASEIVAPFALEVMQLSRSFDHGFVEGLASASAIESVGSTSHAARRTHDTGFTRAVRQPGERLLIHATHRAPRLIRC